MLESIKKVDKKIITMMGLIIGVILIIIIAVIVVALTTGGSISYEKIENKLAKAAESYCNDNSDKLPKAIGDEVQIEASALVSGGYIKDLSEYTDEGVSCSGKVIVGKTATGYDYVSSLDCGKNYKTQFFADKLLENVVTSGSGLYKMAETDSQIENDLMEGYIYRGEVVNNYVKIGDDLYRIVKIDGNNDLTIVTANTRSRGIYDNRYNEDTQTAVGISDYSFSRAKDDLELLYQQLPADSIIKQKVVKKDVCVGPRSADDTSKDGSAECSKVMSGQIYSLIPVFDFLNASLSDKCIKTTDGSCGNYNYLMVDGSVWTMTPTTENTYTAYIANGILMSENVNRSGTYKYVFYLSSRVKYDKGSGTITDPYIIK